MPNQRTPIRAAFAFAGAGSLGTFLAGAMRETLVSIWEHNKALSEPGCRDDDERLLHPEWGHVTIDAVGGSSAGALCGCQLVRALFDPAYVGHESPVSATSTVTGDWIELASFDDLSTEGSDPEQIGRIENPGWTIMSGSALYRVASEVLDASRWKLRKLPSWSPLDPTGVVAIGITLTDLLGYHEYADFEEESVLGHPDFGAGESVDPHFPGYEGKQVRDLGIRKHSEVRKLFVGANEKATAIAEQFFDGTARTGRARAIQWRDAASRLASLAAASAALPLALGPVTITDQIAKGEATLRRLYMDGGVLNNKPVAPALKLGRWQDSVRLLNNCDGNTDQEFDPETVAETLGYRRVCFFIDAFPDRFRETSRSPHPDEAMRVRAANSAEELRRKKAREELIDNAMKVPTKGLGALFDSMLASLRAQDIRGIADTNFRVKSRSEFIGRVIDRGVRSSDFKLDEPSKAHAWSAVRMHPKGRDLPEDQARYVAELVWESDRISGLAGRRSVTMVPIFSPENLVAVLAGEGLYATGGLLAVEARKHDASIGMTVARAVMRSLNPNTPYPEISLQEAPEDALPKDTSKLVERIRIATLASIQGDGSGHWIVRKLVQAPFWLNPLVKLLKTRLDHSVLGLPEPVPPADETDEDRDVDSAMPNV